MRYSAPLMSETSSMPRETKQAAGGWFPKTPLALSGGTPLRFQAPPAINADPPSIFGTVDHPLHPLGQTAQWDGIPTRCASARASGTIRLDSASSNLNSRRSGWFNSRDIASWDGTFIIRGVLSIHHFHNVQCGIENILCLLEYNNDVVEKADQLSRRASSYITRHPRQHWLPQG
jgi:hypothetical protein